MLLRVEMVDRGQARILVAEDDLEMRRLVADALRKDGHEVIEAQDGKRLLYELATREQDSVDLVVSDVRMPQTSGIEVVAMMRELAWRVPVILMTAFGDDDVRARATSLGATLFDKPFDVRDLRRAVRELLAAA